MSSVLHIWASWARAFRLFLDSNNFFSKPVERSTPSHRYPGLKPNRFGGAVPLYSGYSVRKKEENIVFCSEGLAICTIYKLHKNLLKCLCFRPFLSLCHTASQPYRLSQINALTQETIHETQLFLVDHFEFFFHI